MAGCTSSERDVPRIPVSNCTSAGDFKFTNLNFADDAVIFVETLEVLEPAL